MTRLRGAIRRCRSRLPDSANLVKRGIFAAVWIRVQRTHDSGVRLRSLQAGQERCEIIVGGFDQGLLAAE